MRFPIELPPKSPPKSALLTSYYLFELPFVDSIVLEINHLQNKPDNPYKKEISRMK